MSTPELPGVAVEDSVVERASAGARLLTARGVGMRLVSVGSNLALIALVTPADLGLLAVVRGITALAGNTTDLGFAWALIRRSREPTRAEYGALAGLQLTLVLVLLAVVAAFPWLLTAVGAVPPEWHTWMFAVLATTLVIPAGTSAKIRIERRLAYRRVAFYDVTSVLLLNAALLGFAAADRFTIGVFVATGGTILYGNILLWCWSPGPAPAFRLRAWRRLASEFAGFSTGHVANLLYTSATPVLVANMFGLPLAGIWSLATRLGNLLQVAFEGFRRAAVPAAPRIAHSTERLRRLVEDSLLGASRLTVPFMAALFAGLPVIGLLLPRWEPAVHVGQIYVLGFGIAGLASASLVPSAVALHGARVVLAEHLAPMLVGWTGFLMLRLLGSTDIEWVIPPMYGALIVALWKSTDAAVRPRMNPELARLAIGLLAVVAITLLGQSMHIAPVPLAVAAGAVFFALATLPRVLLRARAAANEPRAG